MHFNMLWKGARMVKEMLEHENARFHGNKSI